MDNEQPFSVLIPKYLLVTGNQTVGEKAISPMHDIYLSSIEKPHPQFHPLSRMTCKLKPLHFPTLLLINHFCLFASMYNGLLPGGAQTIRETMIFVNKIKPLH